MNTVAGYSSDDSDGSGRGDSSPHQNTAKSKHTGPAQGTRPTPDISLGTSTFHAARIPISSLVKDASTSSMGTSSATQSPLQRRTPQLLSPHGAGQATSASTKGTSLGVKRAGSPAASSPSRQKLNAHASRLQVGTSSLRQELSPEPRTDSPQQTSETSSAGPSRMAGGVAAGSQALLSLLALPPLVDRDGVEDHEWGLGLPSRGDVNLATQEKLATFHGLKAQGTHFNVSLARNRQLRNPHIFDKLVKWVDVDESGTRYPDMAPNTWAATKLERRAMLREGGKDRLAEMQRRQQEDREAAQALGKARSIDFASSSGSHESRSSGADAAAAARAKAEAVRDSLIKRSSDRSEASSSKYHQERDPRHRIREREDARRHALDRDRKKL
ncbi:Transcriptional regulator [Ceraceosorus bombacis]|uniref:Transcriptional regulator n=1 Tax=Ceraceosorus bombacis TaxID=401625 RepID=A0A0P1BNE8_9BASI|nr:Transcriptional regulator [Ceraceosorus bombacis]